jgi:hypothetical protein
LEDFPEFFEGSERIKIPVFYMIEWEKNIPPNENELSKAALKKFPQDFLSSQPLVVHIYAKKVSEFPSSKIKPLSIRYKNLPKPNLLTRALGKVMPREAYYTLQWKIFEDWLDGKHHEGITMS